MIYLLLTPLFGGALLWLLRRRYAASLAIALLAAAGHLALAIWLYRLPGTLTLPLMPYGFSFALTGNAVSMMFLLLGAALFLPLALFSARFCKDKAWGGAYLFLLFLSVTMLDGALLSDHLGLMLFFWEGLLTTLFGMLLLKNRDNPKAAIKALVLSGTADLILMLGAAATTRAAGTALLGGMDKLPVSGLGALGCACLLLGALGKAACFPFHSWIPAAAADAPTPFLAAFPGSLEKVAGIYLAARVVYQVYDVAPGSPMSTAMLLLGCVTLLGGVAMALIQKDMKRLLSYHAISQVGYMVLGLGTGLAVGLAGGVFHMLNNTLYKAGLFMAAGALEMQTGTTDLKRLGGLRRVMPLTTACVLIFAFSIAGVPLTNGFLSKELIFDAALESGVGYYLVALAGAFMTAASFLKLTRAAFFGELRSPRRETREVGWAMGVPMLALAAGCIAAAAANALLLDGFIGRAFGLEESFSGFPQTVALVLISSAVLALAALDHLYGAKKDGGALHAADHLHHLPLVNGAYDAAERGLLDPYTWLNRAMEGFARLCQAIENGVTWLYDRALPGVVRGLGDALSRRVNGRLSRYLNLAILGMLAVAAIFAWVLR